MRKRMPGSFVLYQSGSVLFIQNKRFAGMRIGHKQTSLSARILLQGEWIKMAEKMEREAAKTEEETLKKYLDVCEYLLIGLGSEWEKAGNAEVQEAYRALAELTEGKNYFIVTTAKDARIFDSALDAGRITAPCGNINWFQCSKGCTKDIWERGEVTDGLCPHCGAPLTENTILATPYIEEGYLKSWNLYREWLAETLNHALLILELGVDFKTPTVIRWPFEKTVFFNRKSHMYRINQKFYQIVGDIQDRTVSIPQNSVSFLCNFCHCD